METLIRFFRANEVIVYSIYGQVFFIMGIAIAVHSMQHSRLHLARYLWLLAGFGLTHGLVEWGYVFIPIQATYVPQALVDGLDLLQFLLLVISFVFLLAFGAGVAFRAGGRWRSMALAVPISAWLLAAVIAAATRSDEFLLAGEVWARYLLAFPACLLSGWGLLAEGKHVQAIGLPHIARYLRQAAGAVWVYGAFSGLVTPALDSLLPARWANHERIFMLIGLPIPVVRSLAALVMAYAIIRSLDVFRVETDRLLQEARDQKLLVARRELAALSAIGVSLGATRDLASVLKNSLSQLQEILQIQHGAVFLTNGQPPVVTAAVCSCGDEPRWTGPGCDGCRELALDLLAAAEPVVLRTAATGEQVLVIALTAGGITVGAVVLLSHQPLELTTEVRQLLTSIGAQIGVAVENARLWEEVRRKEAARVSLLQQIISAQEDERKRIARELHDDTGQALTVAIIQVNTATEALASGTDRARGMLQLTGMRLRQALQDIRRLISDLRPTLLDDLGLVPALRRYLESVGATHGLRLRLRAEDMPARLPSHLETTVFRIVQEGVTNAVKHAEASTVAVHLKVEDGHVVARVQDNGRGFDMAVLINGDPRPGFGLMGMQERVELLGGTLHTRSEPRRGTELLARIPLTSGGKTTEQGDQVALGG